MGQLVSRTFLLPLDLMRLYPESLTVFPNCCAAESVMKSVLLHDQLSSKLCQNKNTTV